MSDYLNLGMLLSILHGLGIESSQPYKLICFHHLSFIDAETET